MCKSFVHVHNHTEYSLLDGANRIPDMVSKAKEYGMPALAITDHGVMFGAMEFYFECVKKGVKPIIGMEAYMAPNGRFNKAGREENQTYHLLLLAKNDEGYRNLCKLHTTAALEGFYYKPRIDHDILRSHAKGLIGTSACLGSEICQSLLNGDFNQANRIAGMYKEMFDEDSFFIELQDHRMPEQAQIKDDLLKIARQCKLPLIATNDAHYLCKESSQTHDVLLCIGTGTLVEDEKRMRFPTDEFYLKSPDEMFELFKDTPEAVENSLRIAEMCNLELGKNRAPMPVPEMPDGATSETFLRELAEKGLHERVANVDGVAEERLNYELSIIEKTKFEDYFLLVREFANFAREQGIAYGVRGSAAGSLVSYAIGITDVDPLEYDLTFERFLNPERISMPDIDMDFEDARRDEMIKYVGERFGSDKVAQIITFGTLGAKAAIKDAGRVLGYLPFETDKICKTIPNVPGTTLSSAYEGTAEFRQVVATDPRFSRLVEVAKEIEGMSRHAGVHAAGIVISKDPLNDYIPLYKGTDGQTVTAFEMGILEKIGLLKMDFLGLSNLTVLSRAVENIARSHPKLGKLNWWDFPLDDQPTYDMLGRGDTVGVFQLESGGMRRNIIEVKPQNVREIAAMVALYRPGPMDHIPTFVDCKFKRKPINYLHPSMEPILSETYGVIVYQDQVLKLVQALAGFSLGKADILRRAMGKKDKDAMDSMKVEFLAGAKERDVPRDAAEKVWELLLPFAGYAFNKAHAVCYALIAYQTAYLKANYPVEYMAALLEVYREKEDRVTAFIDDCRRNKIAVLPPDVNVSGLSFSVDTKVPKGWVGAIKFGLAAIKGVGEKLVEGILKSREEEGPFTHFFEFCERAKPYGLNRSALESLVKAGAFDALGNNRRVLLDQVETALAYADQALRQKEAGQDSLFGEGSGSAEIQLPVLIDGPGPSRSEILAWENETMGIYVSDHPLRGLERHLRPLTKQTCAAVKEMEENLPVAIAGVVASVRTIITKAKGEKMATFVLEDFSGQAACTVFARTYAPLADTIVKDKILIVKGTTTQRSGFRGGETQIEIKVDDVTEFKAPAIIDVADDDSTEGTVIIKIGNAKRDQLETLRRILKENAGAYRVILEFDSPEGVIPMELMHRIGFDDDIKVKIQKVLGSSSIELIEKWDITGETDTNPLELSEAS